MTEGPIIEHAEAPKPTILGKRRTLQSYAPGGGIINKVTELAHGLIGKLPDAVDKKTLNRAVSIEAGFVRSHGLQGVLTRETEVPGTRTRDEKGKPIKDSGLDRGIVFRFQRGEISRALKAFRSLPERRALFQEINNAKRRKEDPKSQIEALGQFDSKFRSGMKELEADLDTLSKQFYEKPKKEGGPGVTKIEIDDPELGKHKIPVLVLDLFPPAEGQEDTRKQDFIIGNYVNNFHEMATLAITMALAGRKVVLPTYPEKDRMATPPKDWLKRVSKDGTLRLYAKLMKIISQKMGLVRPNVTGVSMGAAAALEMATDSDFQINDLTIIEPPTVIDKGTLEQLFNFVVIEGVSATLNAEARNKVVLSQSPKLAKRMKGTDTALAPILARRQITQEELQAINPHGRYILILGDKSSITGRETLDEFAKAEYSRIAANPEANPLETYLLEGGRHGSAVVHSEGIVSQIISAKEPKPGINRVKVDSLENSAARLILNRL